MNMNWDVVVCWQLEHDDKQSHREGYLLNGDLIGSQQAGPFHGEHAALQWDWERID